jgi:hypothetical protein
MWRGHKKLAQGIVVDATGRGRGGPFGRQKFNLCVGHIEPVLSQIRFLLAYTGGLAMTGFCKINGLTPPS